MYGPPLPKEHKGPSPTLRTLHEVERILRKALEADEGPLPLAEIKRRMRAKAVRHSTVRVCVDELKRLGYVAESPVKGVMWTYNPDPNAWRRSGTVRLWPPEGEEADDE